MRGQLDRPLRPKTKVHLPGRTPVQLSLAVVLIALSTALGPASAAPPRHHTVEVELSLSGLRVPINLPIDTAWSVHSHWGAEHAEDVLVLTPADEGSVSFAIELAGRTAKDCPLVDPFPIEIGGETWIQGRGAGGPVLCRMLLDARALVRITHAEQPDVEITPPRLASYAKVLRPLLDALRTRRLIQDGPPRLPAPDGPLPTEFELPTVGLVVQHPEDEMLWRVAPPGNRDFDALIRVVPVFPEVQIAVRRHALAEVSGCARLARHLLSAFWSASDTPAPGDWEGLVAKRVGRFESLAMCRVHEGSLLDVRIATRPLVPIGAFDPILARLAASRVTQPPPPSPLPHAPTRAVLARSATLALGFDFPGTIDRTARVAQRLSSPSPFASVDLALGWTSRNGLALAAGVSLGADGHGALLAASLETGVALALDDELTFVLALALEDRNEALFANRSLSLVFDMRSSQHLPGQFAWSLRMTPLLLVSRAAAITGLPLAISWTGMFARGPLRGLVIGVDLRWVTSPLRASEQWPSEGIAFGLRVGVGRLDR